jgi:hypothetical protein
LAITALEGHETYRVGDEFQLYYPEQAGNDQVMLLAHVERVRKKECLIVLKLKLPANQEMDELNNASTFDRGETQYISCGLSEGYRGQISGLKVCLVEYNVFNQMYYLMSIIRAVNSWQKHN